MHTASRVRSGAIASLGSGAASKLISAVFGLVAVGFVEPSWYAIHTVHLFFYSTLAQWPRTELFRKVMLRGDNPDPKRNQLLMTLSSMCCLAIACGLFLWYILYPPRLISESADHWAALAYYAAVVGQLYGVICKAIGEMPYLELCTEQDYEGKAWIDSTSILAHTLGFYSPILIGGILLPRKRAAVATMVGSAVGEISWASTFLACSMKRRNITFAQLSQSLPITCTSCSLLLQWREIFTPLDIQCLRVEAWGCCQKWLMSELDKLLLMRFCRAVDLGAVSMVQTVCGMIVRTFYIAIEELLQVHYSLHNAIKADIVRSSFSAQKEYFAGFRLLSFVEGAIGMSGVLFAPVFSSAAVTLLLGPAKGELYVRELSRYGWMLWVLACTGTCEGLLKAAGSPDLIRRFQWTAGITWGVTTAMAIVWWLIGNPTVSTDPWFGSTLLQFGARGAIAAFLFSTNWTRDRSLRERLVLFVHPHWLRFGIAAIALRAAAPWIIAVAQPACDCAVKLLPASLAQRLVAAELGAGAIIAFTLAVLIAVGLLSKQELE